MNNEVSVHKYKYSQDSRRRILKKLWKEGFIEYLGLNNKRFYYRITTREGMEEYVKRTKK